MADEATVSGPRTDAGREERILGDHRDRSRRSGRKFKDQQVTMAHGAGRQGDPDADRGPPRAGLRLGGAGRARRRRNGLDRRPRAGADHRQLRGQADPLPRRLDRRAGGERDGQRPRRRRGPPAGAERLAGARGGPGGRRPAGRGGGDGGGRPRRRGWRSSPATPRSSSAGTATRCTSAPPGWGESTRAAALSPGRDRALATGCSSPGTIGEHGTAIMLARGELGLDAEIGSDTRSLWPAVDALLEAAGSGPPLHARRDPGRRGVGAQRAGPSVPGLGPGARGGRPGAAGGDAGPPSCWASTRCTWPTRGCWSPSSRPRRRTSALAALRSAPGCEQAVEIGEVRTEPPGMVLVETAFGGRRVMDLLAGDPLPRIC